MLTTSDSGKVVRGEKSSFSMSVCMSAFSAGISEVLIKYTGNVWLHMTFILSSSLLSSLNAQIQIIFKVAKCGYI